MSEKYKTVETSLLAKTKALRDELKREVEQIKGRLKIIEGDLESITSERNELTAKLRQLEPWWTRIENDLAKLQPVDTPTFESEETVEHVEIKPTMEKPKLTVKKVEEPTEDKKKKTEVKNDVK